MGGGIGVCESFRHKVNELSREGDIFHSTAGDTGEANEKEKKIELYMKPPSKEPRKEEPLEDEEETVDEGSGEKGEEAPAENVLAKGGCCCGGELHGE